MKNGSKLLALIGLGALAYWRYKKATPEEKQKVNDLLDTAKSNLDKFGKQVKIKTDELANSAKNKIDEIEEKVDKEIS